MPKNGSLMGAGLALDTQGNVERLLGPTTGTHKVFDSMTAIHDAVCPPGLGRMLEMQHRFERLASPLGRFSEMQRMFDRLADPFGLSKLADPGRLGGLRHVNLERFGDGESMRAMTAAFQLQRDLFGASKLFDLTRGLESVVGRSAMLHGMTPFMKLERSLAPFLQNSVYGQWQNEFAKTVLPSLGVLGMDWHRPIGALASFAEPRLGASISWLRPDVSTTSVAALLAEESATRSEIVIDVNVPCAFCGDEMIQHERRFRWKGNRKGVLDVSVIPICSTCTRRSNEDAEYLARALRELQVPKLRIVGAGGTTDGVSRGRLRLVREDDDDC